MKILFLTISVLISPICMAISEHKVEVNIKDVKNIPNLKQYSIGVSYFEENPDKEDVILFIHGNSASKEFFEPLMLQQALKNFRLIAVDLPGHGKSDSFPEIIESAIKSDEAKLFDYFNNFYTFPGYANVLNQFLETLKIKSSKVYLFGWSLGGHIAIDLLQENPKIAKIILTGTPINNFEKTAQGFEALSKYPTQAPFPEGLTVLELLGYDKPFTPEQASALHELGGVTPSEMTKSSAMATKPIARQYMIKFAFEAEKQKEKLQAAGYQDQEKTVKEHAEQFIVLQGEKDPIKIQGEDKNRIEAMGVKIYEIKNAGHAVFSESPREVAEFIAGVF